MRLSSILLLIIFTSFLVIPAVISISGGHADVYSYFSMNEEENSVKNQQLSFEYNFEDLQANFKSIQFLKAQKNHLESFCFSYNSIALDVISPPPRTT